MSCCVSKLDLCRLIQESYKSPTFNFGDTDVTNDTFVYKVKIAGESFTEYPCTVIAPNIVVIDEYTLPVGNYIHEMLWTSANGTELIFQGALKITSVGSCCGSNRNNTIKVIQNETIVRINVTESNITIENGKWGSITGDINEQTDLIELVGNAVNDMATQTWVENQNYLTEETDPTVPSYVKAITETDITNWNSKQNQLTAGTNISIVGNTISSTIDLTGYATETWVEDKGYSTFSGSYNDLTDKPTIPTVGNGTITITQGGVSKGSFTTNQSGNTTVEIDAGGGGGADLMVNTTHADLLALVNTNSLVAGQQYRITDYVATVDTDVYTPDNIGFYARSNNHAFDVIVTADSTNKLNENARAIRHEGDTYFPSTIKFESWKLKYTIFNDPSRFDWAVSAGKGVIYRLIDEWNNDFPYDFKSIQFKVNDIWRYTFSDQTTFEDVSLDGFASYNKRHYERYLPYITMGRCSNNLFEEGVENVVMGDYSRGMIIKQGSYNINIGYNVSYVFIGSNCIDINIGDDSNNHSIWDECSDITIDNSTGCKFKIDGVITNLNLTNEITNFTTPPNGNVVNVIKTPAGVVFSQVINATTTESFDV